MLKIRVVKAMLRVTAAAAISLLVAFSASAQTVWYVHTDGLGSVVLTTDKDRNIVERSEYEPYGNLLNRPLTDGPGYTGHVMDATTGLAYMQQRYYDQTIGRLLSVDPVMADSNAGGNFNRYKYAANNPYRFTDPDGRQEIAAERFSDSYGNWTSEERVPFEAVAIPVTAAIVATTPVVGPELALGLRVATRNAEAVPRTGPKGVDPGRHNANVTVRDNDGNIVSHHREVSGNMTAAEKELGFPQNTLASHTEARAVQTSVRPGESMTITGQRAPCPSCKGKMNSAAERTGTKIKYQWREDGKTRRWETK